MAFFAPYAYAQEYDNPLKVKSIPTLVDQIAGYVLALALPIAVMVIIIVGFKFITASASGDTKGVGDAKKIFVWVLIGIAVVVGAKALSTAVVEFLKAL